MRDYSIQNKKAWEYSAHEFWLKYNGTPAELAEKAMANPLQMLKRFTTYFDTYEGTKIANICGSCGKKAIPLALLGAEVTIFDISEDNRRYALEEAAAAHVDINYVIGDVLDIDLKKYAGYFDIVFMEGGILHYFHDIEEFTSLMNMLLKPGGKIICNDFHPFTKIIDVLHLEQPTMTYFSTEIFEFEMAHARFYEEEIRTQMPKCLCRKYTISEIINAVIRCGFTLERFDEHPAWENPDVPGEFTIVAKK
jgi:2-polyprenyl-3-methyl-5-hydroxy-6-metoxy-1,4-benzoquinol methylase